MCITGALGVALIAAAGCVFTDAGFAADRDAAGFAADAATADAPPGSADASAVPDASMGTVDAAVVPVDAAVDAAVVPVDAAVVPVDAAVDAGLCPGDALGFVPSNVASCDIPMATDDLELTFGTYQLNTDTETLAEPFGGTIPLTSAVVPQVDAPEILVVSVNDFVVDGFATLEVQGSRVLVVVAFGDIAVDGTIRSRATGSADGAGASDATACAIGFGDNGVVQTAGSLSAGSGGGGGAYGETGGNGAPVANIAVAFTPGGDANGNATITPLRGGCRGGDGGGNGGDGGGGSGGMQFAAQGTVLVSGSGQIAARGGGGQDVTGANSGGGGGGSGGAILIEANAIEINGDLTTNGGGGGEGSRSLPFSDDGQDGRESSATPADGGQSAGNAGGNGGDGGALASAAENGKSGTSSDSSLGGGGGGGGSVGRIRLRAVSNVKIGASAVISPAPAP